MVKASPLHLPTPSTLAATALASNGIPAAAVTWHDVTEARRLLVERTIHAETEARRALLQCILDELPSSVYLVYGNDARLILANRAAATVFGAVWRQDQPMSEFLAEHGIRLLHTDGRELPLPKFATLRAVRQGETISGHQEHMRRADGTILPVLVSAVALRMDQLNVSPSTASPQERDLSEWAALVVHQDVSALKEAERIKDEFISIAAHELRTPLAVLKGYAQMLILQTARGKGPELAEWQMESLQSIDQSTVRLVELTEDLLDVSRLQAGRLELHPQPLDLVALSRRVIMRT